MDQRKLKLILLLFFISFHPFSAYSQKEEWKEMVEKNSELKIEIKSAIADSVSLYTALSKFNYKLDSTEFQIAAIDSQIIRVKQSMTDDSILVLKSNIDTLNILARQIDSVLHILMDNMKRMDSIKLSIENEIELLRIYDKVKLEKQYAKNKSVMKKKYSKISYEELDTIISTKDRYASIDNYSEYLDIISNTKTNLDLYTQSYEALNNPFNDTKVMALRGQLYDLLNREQNSSSLRLTKEQFSELDSLDIKLSRYKSGVRHIKEIVELVNTNELIAKCRENGNSERCLAEIENVISPTNEEIKYVIDRYFKMIPYLSTLFDDYCNELRKNPLSCRTSSVLKIEQLDEQ